MSFKQDISLQRKVLGIGVLIMIVKMWAYDITGSNAILTDALESIVNLTSGSFALFSLWLAAQPSDKNHPYGHGKIEFIAGFLEGGLIVLAGLTMIGKGGYHLFHPQLVQDLLLGMILTSITGMANFIMGVLLKRQGGEKQSMIMISGGTHLISDGYTSFAIVGGVALIWLTKLVWIDNVLAILFGLYIAYAGAKIIRQSVAGIMDEVDPKLVEKIILILNHNRQDSWIDIHNLRVVKYGRNLHVDCHVTLPWYNTLEQSHDILDDIECIVKKEMHSEIEFFIHADPCVPQSCSLCSINDCPERRFEFVEKVNWKLDNVLPNKKHRH